MKRERSQLKMFIYILIAVILPVIGILVNHLYKPDHILLSMFFVVWMGFFLMALQPFDVEGFETIDP